MQARHVLTILAVRDLRRAVTFYLEAFGWKQVVDVPVYAELVTDGGMRLGLYDSVGFGRNIGRSPSLVPETAVGATEIYLHCDDLPGSIDRLVRAGARELSPLVRREWGDDAAYFADPDGNVIVVARPSAG